MSASDDIAAERRRQIEAKGWTPEHDDGHVRGEIATAAADYLMPGQQPPPHSWARDKSKHDRRTQIIIGCALGLAEIERLDRARDRPAPHPVNVDRAPVRLPPRPRRPAGHLLPRQGRGPLDRG